MKRVPLKRKTPLRAKSPMRRGKPIARGRVKATITDPAKAAAPKRAKRVRARNPKRRAVKHERNYAGPDGEHCRFIRSLPCAVKGRSMLPEHDCRGRVEDAHVVPRGMSGSNGCWADTVPLCTKHHREAGERGTSDRAAFERRYRVNLRHLADDLAAERIGKLARRFLARPFDVTDDLMDAPDGAVVDGFERVGDQWLPVPVAGYDLAALLGWVRRRLAMEAARVESPVAQAAPLGTAAVAVGRALGMYADPASPTGHEMMDVMRLCEAAGWLG